MALVLAGLFLIFLIILIIHITLEGNRVEAEVNVVRQKLKEHYEG
jgi:hypothetical protein